MNKIGLITSLDPLDKTAWSGIYFKIYESLINEGFEVEILGPYIESKAIQRLIFICEKLNQLFTNKRYYHHGSLIGSYFRGRYFSTKLKNSNCEVIFGITASKELAFLKTKRDIFYFNDASFSQLRSYYSIFNDLSSVSVFEANLLEKKTLKKSKNIIYPSQWAKDFTINFYKLNPSKIKVFKMGSNINYPESIIGDKIIRGTVKFLFLGVDWERKGGEIVLNVLNKIRKLQIDLELTICGCMPNIKDDFIKIIPFLNKNIPEDYSEMQKLLQESHFLFLPTQAECYGIVFAEASAYGLPIIAMDTGGVSSVVKNNVNGMLLSADASEDDYVDKIMYLINNQEEYTKMSNNSRKYYDEELDWKVFGKNFRRLINSE